MPFLTLATLIAVHSGIAAARDFVAWEQFDQPHPICERPISLAVGQESFFEVANSVEGQADYNHLIRLFRKRKWEELETGVESFLREREKSPLREAVTFLQAQAYFDKDRLGTDAQQKQAEKRLRNALLLYPTSEFGPIMTATAGAYWLRHRQYQRSLAVYELASSSFPTHPLFCTFRLGAGEGHFFLRHWDKAKSAYTEVLSACSNFRLRSGAAIRLVDLAYASGEPAVERRYEQLVEDENPFIERLYQPVLANLGEIKYQAGKYKEADYFLRRYLSKERGGTDCLGYASKRLADTSRKLNVSAAQMIGQYLEVKEHAPQTDIARYSHAHGLLADPKLKGGAELDRRIRLVDELADGISDESLRSRVYVEKGLTLLEMGRPEALGYLANLKAKSSTDFSQGEAGVFIRQKVMALARSGTLAPLDSEKFFPALATVSQLWLRDSPQEQQARELYSEVTVQQTERALAQADFSQALRAVQRWKASPLALKPSTALQARLGHAWLTAVYRGGRDGKAALAVIGSESLLKPLVGDSYALLFQLAQLELSIASKKIGKGKSTIPRPGRELSSVLSGWDEERQGLYRLALARAMRLQGDYLGARSVLEGIQTRPWAIDLRNERTELAIRMGDGERAFSLLASSLEGADAEAIAASMQRLTNVFLDLKVWGKSSELAQLAERWMPDKEARGEVFHIAGKAESESSRCPQAIGHLEKAFELAPSSGRGAESHFRLGKCYAEQKRNEAAHEQWKQAAALQDSFWSPLATGQIKLLFP